MKRLLLLLLFSGLVICGCKTTQNAGLSLIDTSSGFNESMRWKDFEGASIYMKPDIARDFLGTFVEDDDLFVVDSRTVRVVPGNDEKEVDVIYEMSYYRLPSTSIKKWRWQQRWVEEKKSSTEISVWLISNEAPELPWQKSEEK